MAVIVHLMLHIKMGCCPRSALGGFGRAFPSSQPNLYHEYLMNIYIPEVPT